jgi:short-subunit dehydrogenase
VEIAGKVVVVTGASAGIGAATARLVAAQGAHTVLAARRLDRIEALAAELGDSIAVRTDMRDPDQIHRLVRRATEEFGGVDVLVNNAGQGTQGLLRDMPLADFAAITELNVYAPLIAMQAVVPSMVAHGGGSIVNVSSGTTLTVPPEVGAYAATKAALNMLSKVARVELADDGIVVSTIYPFVTTTEFFDVLRAGRTGMPDRPGLEPQTPEYVAEAILDLIRTGAAETVLVPDSLRRPAG